MLAHPLSGIFIALLHNFLILNSIGTKIQSLFIHYGPRPEKKENPLKMKLKETLVPEVIY